MPDDRDGVSPKRRSRRYSWMMNGWTSAIWLDEASGGTEVMAIGVPDDFVAVRAGFANINPAPWTVRKIIACASSSWSDFVNPLDEARDPRPALAWSTLTFQNAGADREPLVTAQDAPAQIIVAGNATDPAAAKTSNPAWTFTDWVPCASVGADPATGMRVLMLRAMVLGGQAVSFSNGRMTEYGASPWINRGYGYFTGGLKQNTDLVSDPVPFALPGMSTATLDANHLVNGQLICLVQALTRNAGVVGLITGDSHQAGTGTTSGINNFLVQCLLELGRGSIGMVPVGVVSTAAGGLSSAQFFPRMTALLRAVRPDFVVLPAWSYNEHDGTAFASAAVEDILFVRMILAADQARAAGAIPVFMTPLPRNAPTMTPAVLDAWLTARDAVIRLRDAGEYVLDATPLLSETRDGKFTGTYLDGLSSDTIHPNNAGHAVLAKAMLPLVRDIAGLTPSASLPPLSVPVALPAPVPGADAEADRNCFLARLRWHEG